MNRYVIWCAIVATIWGFLAWLAHASRFFPMKYPQGQWDLQQQLGAEEVWIRTADGIRLNAWWLHNPGSPIATLFLHGNAGNLTHRASSMDAIRKAGASVLVVDYRGYGKSEGSPSEQGVYRDSEAGWQFLIRRGYQPEQIVVHGESLGTAVAVELASRHPCRALILEAPFSSASAVAGTVIPGLGRLLISGLDSKSRIGRVHVPLLVIHGDRDEVIDLSLGKELFEAANPPKEMWVVPGADHNGLLHYAGAQYVDRIAAAMKGRGKW